MLTRGFAMLNNGVVPDGVPAQTQSQPVSVAAAPTTMSEAYSAATTVSAPKFSVPQKTVSGSGSAGVQFGAFSSNNAATNQAKNVKNKLGVNAIVETTGSGMYRVRVYGLSDGAAQQLKQNATTNGIDSYVFH
jgi:cell division protein FtsN